VRVQMHPTKTKIATANNRRRGDYPNVTFDFLGISSGPTGRELTADQFFLVHPRSVGRSSPFGDDQGLNIPGRRRTSWLNRRAHQSAPRGGSLPRSFSPSALATLADYVNQKLKPDHAQVQAAFGFTNSRIFSSKAGAGKCGPLVPGKHSNHYFRLMDGVNREVHHVCEGTR